VARVPLHLDARAQRSLVHEKDQGCLEALLLAPVDRPVIFFGKPWQLHLPAIVKSSRCRCSSSCSSRQAIEGPIWMIALSLLVGSIGIAGVGTLLATMSVNTKGKDFILAVLFVRSCSRCCTPRCCTSAVIIGTRIRDVY